VLGIPPIGCACGSLKPAPFKTLLQEAAERSVAGVWAAIERFVDVFPPQECTAFFAAAGYDPKYAENALWPTLTFLGDLAWVPFVGPTEGLRCFARKIGGVS